MKTSIREHVDLDGCGIRFVTTARAARAEFLFGPVEERALVLSADLDESHLGEARLRVGAYRLGEPVLAHRGGRPAAADHVLVESLAGAEPEPEAPVGK